MRMIFENFSAIVSEFVICFRLFSHAILWMIRKNAGIDPLSVGDGNHEEIYSPDFAYPACIYNRLRTDARDRTLSESDS